MSMGTRRGKQPGAHEASGMGRGDANTRQDVVEELRVAIERQDWRTARVMRARCQSRYADRADVLILGAHLSLRAGNDAPRAVKDLQKALRRVPDSPEALRLLSSALRVAGDLPEAAVAARRAIELEPEAASAYLDLALSDPGSDPTLGTKIEAALERVPEPKGMAPSMPKAFLNAARGRVHEVAGEHAQAFERFQAAKRAVSRGYRPDQREKELAETRAVFTPDYLAAHKGHGVDDDRPIFIVGLPRCGAGVLERLLSAHPKMVRCAERGLFGQVIGDAVTKLATDNPSGRGGLARFGESDPTLSRKAANRYLELVRATLPRSGFARWIDGTTANFRLLGAIALLFPKAHVIAMERDPRDHAISCLSHVFESGGGFSRDLAALSHFQRAYRNEIAHWREVLGKRMSVVSYEAITAEPRLALRKLVEAAGLSWDPQMGAACAEVHARSVGRWRSYEAELAPLIAELEQDLQPTPAGGV